jgi:hypothetical protein
VLHLLNVVDIRPHRWKLPAEPLAAALVDSAPDVFDGLSAARCSPKCRRASYSLTEYGESLRPVTEAICQWGKHHMTTGAA